MNSGSPPRSRGSFGGGDRGFRMGGRGRGDGYSSRGRGGRGLPSRGNFGGRRPSPRGGGGGRYDAGRRETAYSRDFESSRPPRDYRSTLTPPPFEKERRYGGSGYDREMGYRLERADFRPPVRDTMGPRDYSGPRDVSGPRDYMTSRPNDRGDPRDFAGGRDYPPRSSMREYPPEGRRYSLEGRDMRGGGPGFRARYDDSPPRTSRREYNPPPSRSFGSLSDDYPGSRRLSDGGRGMGMRNMPPDGYARGGPSPRDDHIRDIRTRRLSPPFDDDPPAKRMRGGPMMSRGGRSRPMRSSRGGPPRRF